MSEPIKESIALALDASGIKGDSLAGLLAQLKAVEQHVERVNAALNGMNFGGPARSAKELEAALLKVKNLNTGTGSNYAVAPLAKALGADATQTANFERFIARQKKAVEGYVKSQQAFRNLPAFTRTWAKFEKQSSLSVADLLKPGVSKVTGGTVSAGSIKVDGQIGLIIPGTQVQASVTGPVTLTIAGSQVTGTVAGAAGANAPGTGQFTAGNAAGGKAKNKKAVGPLNVPQMVSELHRVRTETDSEVKEAVTVMNEVGDLVTSVHDSIEGIIKTTTRSKVGNTPLAKFQQWRSSANEEFKQLKAGLGPNANGIQMAALMRKQSAQLLSLFTPELDAALGPGRSALVQTKLTDAATTLESQARATQAKAVAGMQSNTWKGWFQQHFGGNATQFNPSGIAWNKSMLLPAGIPGLPQGPQLPPGYAGPGGPAVVQQGPQLPPGYAGPGNPAGRGRRGQMYGPFQPNVPPPAQPKPPKPTPMQNALQAFTPMGFATHLVKVSGWATAVGVLYKSLELAQYSLHRFIAVGEEMAHLSVVFRGVGGSARQLTDDVMQLAVANGRSTEEAMESATEWSRLGLNRAQVNEVVKVSMVAANVAQISTGESTKQLSSLMHIYRLQVSDLNGVLGMLTNSSLKYNVTLDDLFQGLDRSAGVAKEAGMGLAELQGLLAATVGKTGQSGVIVGNTIKSILVQFSNPTIQKLMRGQGIEVTTKGGGLKSGSEILRDTFVRYQGMDARTRGDFSRQIAGRFGAARFVGMMDGYVEAQKLAIDGQLHLNAAQVANVAILATMKAQLIGVKAEWDRLMVNSGAMDGGGEMARTLKNSLRFLAGGQGADPVQQGRQRSARDRTIEDYQNETNPFRRFANYGLMMATTSGRLAGSEGFSAINDWVTGGRNTDLMRQQPGLIDYFNYSQENAGERGNAAFQNQIQTHFAAAGAQRGGANLFNTMNRVLGNGGKIKGEDLESMAEMMKALGSGGGEQLKAQYGSGNIAGVRSILTGAEEVANAKSIEESRAGMLATTERLAQIAADPKMSVKDKETQNKEAKNQQEAYNAALEEEEGLRAQQIARAQEYVNLLKEQADVMQAISQLAGQQGLDTLGSRNDAEVRALQQQRDQLEATQKRLLTNGMGVEGMPAWDQSTEMLRNVNADLASKSSPQMQAAIGAYDNRAIAARRATGEANSYGVGYTEAEKLLREEGKLKSEIAKVGPNADENGVSRAMQFQIELAKTQQKIQERIVELKGQEKQILIDSAREYQKSLLFAGPGELLKKLYVGSVAGKRNPSAGEFMSWDESSRKTFYDMRGGDAGAKNREEQWLLRGRGLTVAGEQTQAGRNRAAVDAWGRRKDTFTSKALGDSSSMPLPNLSSLDKQALTTAASIGSLGKSADGVTAALGRLESRLNGLNPGSSPPPASKGFDVSSGHSLGAQAPSGPAYRLGAGMPWGFPLTPEQAAPRTH